MILLLLRHHHRLRSYIPPRFASSDKRRLKLANTAFMNYLYQIQYDGAAVIMTYCRNVILAFNSLMFSKDAVK